MGFNLQLALHSVGYCILFYSLIEECYNTSSKTEKPELIDKLYIQHIFPN